MEIVATLNVIDTNAINSFPWIHRRAAIRQLSNTYFVSLRKRRFSFLIRVRMTTNAQAGNEGWKVRLTAWVVGIIESRIVNHRHCSSDINATKSRNWKPLSLDLWREDKECNSEKRVSALSMLRRISRYENQT